MLMPAAVLVMIVLASIAIDTAIVWAGQRELANRAAAAANDIAAMAIDDESFYGRGEVRLDEATARDVVAAYAEADAPLRSIVVEAVVVDERDVRVQLSGTVRGIFAPALPGARRDRTVRASATAAARG